MAITRVQSGVANTNGGTTLFSSSTDFGSNQAVGNLIVAVVNSGIFGGGGGGNPSSYSGWTLAAQYAPSFAPNAYLSVFWRIADAADQDVPTITWDNNSQRTGVIIEYASDDDWPADPFDAASSGAQTGTGTTSQATGSSGSLTDGNHVGVAALGISGGTISSPAADGDYTWFAEETVNEGGGNSANILEVADALDLTGTTATSTTFSWTTSHESAAFVVVFIDASGSAVNVAATTVSVAIALPSVVATGAASAAPTTVDVPISIPTPAVLAASLVDGVTIAVPVALPQPSTGIAAVASPTPIDVPATLPAPTVTGEATVTPLSLDAVAVLPQPVVAVAAGAVAQRIDVPVALPAPGIAAAALVTATTIPVPIALPQGVASVAATVNPTVVAVVSTLPVPAVAFGATVTAAVIMVNTSIPQGTIFSGIIDILARVFGQFHRLGARLHIARVGRGLRQGFRVTDEGWERVSDVFIFDESEEGDANPEATMEAVAGAWAAHAGDDADTLKTAIHEALDALGYRRPDGTRLV